LVGRKVHGGPLPSGDSCFSCHVINHHFPSWVWGDKRRQDWHSVQLNNCLLKAMAHRALFYLPIMY